MPLLLMMLPPVPATPRMASHPDDPSRSTPRSHATVHLAPRRMCEIRAPRTYTKHHIPTQSSPPNSGAFDLLLPSWPRRAPWHHGRHEGRRAPGSLSDLSRLRGDVPVRLRDLRVQGRGQDVRPVAPGGRAAVGQPEMRAGSWPSSSARPIPASPPATTSTSATGTPSCSTAACPSRWSADMVEDSYDLIVSKLSRARQRALLWRGAVPYRAGGRRAAEDTAAPISSTTPAAANHRGDLLLAASPCSAGCRASCRSS